MEVMDILVLLAIFFGPIVAVQVTQMLDRKRQKRYGKEFVFKALMRTRTTPLNPFRVEALNMIDVEFYGDDKRNEDVVAAWREYSDHLNKDSSTEFWHDKEYDLFVDLLHTMSCSLCYNLDKETIRNTHYNPKGHADYDRDMTLIRKGILGALDEEGAIRVSIMDNSSITSDTRSGDEKTHAE